MSSTYELPQSTSLPMKAEAMIFQVTEFCFGGHKLASAVNEPMYARAFAVYSGHDLEQLVELESSLGHSGL